jgi:PEP-CTERM motif
MKTFMSIALAALAVASQANAASIINGDFETGPYGGTPAGFTVSPGAEIITVAGSDYIPCCGVTGTPAELANHFAAFGGDNLPNASTLNQIFSTEEGGRYTVSFDFGVLGGGVQTIFATAYADGGNAVLGTLSATRASDNNLSTTFGRYTFNFIGASSSTRLSFNLDPATDSVDGILDNVSIAVPEPAAWAMMIAGFGLIGAAGRRRRSLQITCA